MNKASFFFVLELKGPGVIMVLVHRQPNVNYTRDRLNQFFRASTLTVLTDAQMMSKCSENENNVQDTHTRKKANEETDIQPKETKIKRTINPAMS